MKEKVQKEDTEKFRALATIGYLGPLCFIPLAFGKENAFAKHHGKQGFILFLFWIVILIAFWLLEVIFGFIFGFFPPFRDFFLTIFDIVKTLLVLFCFILMVTGIVQALRLQLWRMPILGAYAEHLKI